MSQEAKENTERIKIICWTGHKRKKRELDKRQEKRWVRTTSVSVAGLPTHTDKRVPWAYMTRGNAKHPWHFPQHRAGEGLSTGTRETKRHTAQRASLPFDGTDAGLHVFLCNSTMSVLDLRWPEGLRVWLHITFPPFPKSEWNRS